MIAVVLGARGGTGRECVKALVQRTDFTEVRAVVRNAAQVQDDHFPKDERIKVVEGDVTSKESLDKVLAGATHAIFAAAGGRGANAEVDEQGLLKTMQAAEQNGLRRVAICSSQLVDPINRWAFVRVG